MKYIIRFDYCVGCDNCISVCPVHAISYFQTENNHGYKLDETKCIHCGKCMRECPCDAIIEG